MMDTFEYRADDVAVETVMRTARTGRNANYSNNGYDYANYSDSNGSDNGSDAARSASDGTHIYYESCDEHQSCDLGKTEMITSGRLMDVDLTLRNVCPGRRVALGVTVHERDSSGREYARGFKAVTVPAHQHKSCQDLDAPTLRFILPEDLRVENNGRRHFVVRATTHYVDTSANL